MILRGIKRAKRATGRLLSSLAPGPLVLGYHRVSRDRVDRQRICVSPRNLDEHLTVLRRKARLIGLGELASGLRNRRLPTRTVTITFDDGYADNLFEALPLLEKHGCPATVYVVSGAVGSEREFWWDELAFLLLELPHPEEELSVVLNGERIATWERTRALLELGQYFFGDQESSLTGRHVRFLSLYALLQGAEEGDREEVLGQVRLWCGIDLPLRVCEERRILTLPELLRLDRSDLIEIGSHTASHPLLIAHSAACQRREIVRGKQELEQLLGHPVISLAYPHGGYNCHTVGAAAEAGFSTAVTCKAGMVTRADSALSLPRQMVGNWSGEVFERKLAQWWGGRS